MGCGCKNETNLSIKKSNLKSNSDRSKNFKNKLVNNKFFIYTTKFIFFLISIPILFLILPYIFWVLFKTIVLSKSNNLVSDLSKILPTRKRSDDEEDDDDDGDEDGDEMVVDEYGQDYDDVTENLIDVELVNETKKNI